MSKKEERNIYREDVVSFLDKESNKLEYGVVFRVAWEIDDLESDSEDNDEDDDDDNQDEDEQEESVDSLEEEKKNTIKKNNSNRKKELGYEYLDDDEEEEMNHLNADMEYFREKFRHYSFKSGSGVLVHLIRAPVYTEIEYDKLTLVDRTLYLADFVQRVGSDPSNQQLGKILSTHKLYSVYPFSFLTANPDEHLGSDPSKMIHLETVSQVTPFVQNAMVMNKSKTVFGRVLSYQQDLVVRHVASKRGTILPNAELDFVTVEGVYDSFFCPGKIVVYRKERYLILTIVPTKVEVNWYYYRDENADPPPTWVRASDIIAFEENYDFSMIGENILFMNDNGIREGGLVFLTKTWCKVSWQDGSVTDELSNNFVVVDSLATDYFPGDAVEPADVEEKHKWGVIKIYNPEKRTCTIQWNVTAEQVIEETDVSVYSVEYLEDYNFDESDFVFKSDASLVKPENDVVGQIVGRDKCLFKVRWNNGQEELVYPYQLCLIEDDDEDDEEDEEDDEDDSESDESEEQVIDDILNSIKLKEKDIDEDSSVEWVDDVSGDDQSIPNNNNSNNNNNNNNNNNSTAPSLISGVINSFKSLLFSNEPSSSTLSTSPKSTTKNDKDEIVDDGKEIQSFELLTSIDNHAYYSEKTQFTTKLLKTISQEFQLLETSLPSGIYVKGYSEKMNLLQALIIGPADTVYENGIFIFDIFLPNTYPSIPPKVFYHSVTYKLHPNLYVNGNVCLSLLGTWHGNKNEQWQPGLSNLLQVLISIQGLILGCKEPYFLEAGYDSQIGTNIGMRNSSLYNEEVYLLTLETLLWYNENKPNVFKTIINRHLSTKKDIVLSRINQFFKSPKSSPLIKPTDTTTTTTTTQTTDISNNNENNNITEPESIFGITLPPTEGFVSPLNKLRLKIENINKK